MNLNFNTFLNWENGSRDTVDFKKTYVYMAGCDLVSGLLLSQIVYYYLPSKYSDKDKLRVEKNGHFWIAKARDEWWDEICISPKQFDHASSNLVDIGLIEKKVMKFDNNPTIHVRIIQDNFMKAWHDAVNPLLTKGKKGNYPKAKKEIDQTVNSCNKEGYIEYNKEENTTPALPFSQKGTTQSSGVDGQHNEQALFIQISQCNDLLQLATVTSYVQESEWLLTGQKAILFEQIEQARIRLMDNGTQKENVTMVQDNGQESIDLSAILSPERFDWLNSWLKGNGYKVKGLIDHGKDVSFCLITKSGSYTVNFSGNDRSIVASPAWEWQSQAITTTNVQGDDYLMVTPEQMAQANSGKGEDTIVNAPSMFGTQEMTPAQEKAYIAEQLAVFEARNGISSQEFYAKWQAGEARDTYENNVWAMTYEAIQKVSHKAKAKPNLFGIPVILDDNMLENEVRMVSPQEHIGNANKMVQSTVSGIDMASGQDKIVIVSNPQGLTEFFSQEQWNEMKDMYRSATMTKVQKRQVEQYYQQIQREEDVPLPYTATLPQRTLGFDTSSQDAKIMATNTSNQQKRNLAHPSAVSGDSSKPKPTVKDYHDKAMEYMHWAISIRDFGQLPENDTPLLDRQEGKDETVRQLFLDALKYERLAAENVPSSEKSEPTRSILYCSAASLAYNAQSYEVAKELIKTGLTKNTPQRERDKLLGLRKDVDKAMKALVTPKVAKLDLPQVFLEKWCEEVLGYQIASSSWGREKRTVKALLTKGTDFEEKFNELAGIYRYMKQKPYCKDRHVFIQEVASNLPAWIGIGRPSSLIASKPQWQLDKEKREAKRDESSALWSELVRLTGGLDSQGNRHAMMYGRTQGKEAKAMMSAGLKAVVEKMSQGGMYSTIMDMDATGMEIAFRNAIKRVIKE